MLHLAEAYKWEDDVNVPNRMIFPFVGLCQMKHISVKSSNKAERMSHPYLNKWARVSPFGSVE